MLTDAPHTTPLDGNCPSTLPGNPCTPRAAVQATNFVGGGPNQITLATAGIYALTVAGPNKDNAATGDPDVNSILQIVNSSNGPITISAAGINDRVFDVGPTGLGFLVLTGSPQGLAITGGLVTDNGGGILIRPAESFQADGITVNGNVVRPTRPPRLAAVSTTTAAGSRSPTPPSATTRSAPPGATLAGAA